MTAASPAGQAQVRAAYYADIDHENLAPLWEVMGSLVPREPTPICRPAHWEFGNVRKHLYRAGELISAEEAERRVLVLENPSMRGQSSVTRSLYAGYQLLLPGEVAPAHRHTATAIRLMLQGKGGYTSVDGERTSMERGDFIITPSWTFHDHTNPGQEPVIWLDGLDVPLVRMFEAGFSELLGDRDLVTRPQDDSLARYGSGLAPESRSHVLGNPIFRYPYSRTREVLMTLERNGPVHRCHAIRQEFINPLTGGSATATMAACMQLLPAGFRGHPSRCTDSTVYCAVEGSGCSVVGTERIEWAPGDTFVVPSWMPLSHECDARAILFSFSDRPAQRALGIWRQLES